MAPRSRRAHWSALDHGPIVAPYGLDPLVVVDEAKTEGLPAADEIDERLTALSETVHAAAGEIAAQSDRAVETATAVGRPAPEILASAAEHDVDHVVMGSHGRRGRSRFVLGSVTERVVREAPMPVMIVR